MKLENVQDPSTAAGAIPLRLNNVAPLEGHREIGLVPYGLTALLALNGKGKSRALEAVLAIPLEATHPEDLLTIQRGQNEALAGLGTAEIRIATRETGAGKTRNRTDRSGETSQGPIHRLPDPVGRLITGGDHVSADANWRCRLEALLNVAPADFTEVSLSELAGVLPAPDGDIAAALIERHTAKPFADLLAAADWLADGKSALLHTRKRQAKAEAETLGLDVERLLGKMAEIERAGAAASGLPVGDAAIKRLLLDESAAAAPAEFSALESAFALLTARVQERDRTRQEREQIRAGLGERPSTEAEEAEVCRCAEAAATAQDAHEAARQAAATAGGRLAALQAAAEPLRGAVAAREADWWAAAMNLRSALAVVDGMPPTELAARVVRESERLHEAVVEAEAALASVGDAGVRAAETRVAVDVAGRAVAGCLDRGYIAQAALDTARARQETWDRTVARLEEPLPPLFPKEEDLTIWLDALIDLPEGGGEPSDGVALFAAKAKLDALRPRAKAAASGPAYRAAEAERLRLYAAKTAAEDRAERLEAEVSRVWDRLAEIISESLHSDVLRVSPGRLIEIRLPDGRWVDVADDEEASTGTIRRAMLSFYLDRVPAGERNIVLPDTVMLPIDQQGREEISRLGARKQLRLMFEQPVLGDSGDDAEIRCIFYGGAA